MSEEIVNCKSCGSYVTPHKTLDGAVYFTPANVPYSVLEELQKRLDDAIKKLNEVNR